jgi:CotS family spore coat protein
MKKLLQAVRKKYGLNVKSFAILRKNGKSIVIKLFSDRGTYIVKRLNISVPRQRFILAAETYLRKQGIRIPKVKKSKRQKPFMIWKGRPLVVQAWAKGEPFFLRSVRRIKTVARYLGKIHAASKGFTHKNKSAWRSTRAARWKKEYQAALARIKQWNQRHSGSSEEKIAAIREYVPFFLSSGAQAQKDWQPSSCLARYLCHGDFHMRNVLHRRKKLTIIDWEHVRYDFPSKDIARLLTEAMRGDWEWKEERFTHLLSAYLRQNPLGPRQLALLYQDLAFPHMFARFLHRERYRKMSLAKLKRFLQSEQEKTLYMLGQLNALAEKRD